MIHVAICFTDPSETYYKYALVTVASIFDNTKSAICLHIVHDETFTSTIENVFRNLCSQYGHLLSLYHVGEISNNIVQNVLGFLGKGALYRIKIPDLIFENKVLYFDCDIIATYDIAKIYNYDISGNYFGAVRLGKKQELGWSKRYGLTSSFCVNSGVLLMNLEKIRREIPDYSTRLFDIVQGKGIRMGDQGAMNIFFDGNPDAFLLLPEFCNFRIEPEDHAVLPLAAYRGKILHFAGKKPWEVFSTPAVFYWKYYAALFPDENVFERMESLEPYEYAPLFPFLLRHEKLRRWVNRLYEVEARGLGAMLWARLFPRARKAGRGEKTARANNLP
jgi:lipopolysaccharide biosynthesis glycosyltransferase